MNPYTRSLINQLHNPALKRFVDLWDSFEALAIDVYRLGECSEAAYATYAQNLAALKLSYPKWEEALGPHWRASRIKDRQDIHDPFRPLLDMTDCTEWIANQEALRLLPAAREAINRYLKELLAG